MNEPISMLLFFTLFEVLGGAGFGIGLRSLLKRSFAGSFFLVWGAGFAGIPLFIGAVTFFSTGHPVYFFAQAFILFAAVVVAAFVPDDIFQSGPEGVGEFGGAIVGAVMAMLGAAVIMLNIHAGGIVGLLIGGVFALLGALILIASLLRVMRTA